MRAPCVFAVLCFLFVVHEASASDGPVDQSLSAATLRGRVVDSTGAAIVGAQVAAMSDRPGTPVASVTNERGEYEIALLRGAYTVGISAVGFADASSRTTVADGTVTTLDFKLHVAGIQESVRVGAVAGYLVPTLSSATKTVTPLRDVPQAISVVSSMLIADQRMASMGDVVRYIPGVGMAQGEGNRDAPIMRGNSTTADFFVDGVRDDVQYFRDVYNVERVEALKGPNAMIFGRGGIGGVINRVTRQADWGQPREAALQFGSWNNRRATADLGSQVGQRIAVRGTGVYENSDSHRNGVALERYGLNPSLAVRLGSNTLVRASYEHFSDQRTADRGISSSGGRPVNVDQATFFGDPSQSYSDATVNLITLLAELRLNSRVTLRNRASYGAYDKFYQNVFPGAVNAGASTVAINAYNSATDRRNLFNQSDLIASAQTGRIGHTLLIGAELGRQETDNFRNTGYFPSVGATATSLSVALSAPTVSVPVSFRQSATDADNHGVATVTALYAQDQVALSPRVDAIVGVRLDRFGVNFTNNRTATDFSSTDDLLSPRVGLIYKPIIPLSFYGSYSMTYAPRAGEQLASLSLTNQALDPEEFRNYEIGTKWDVAPTLALTAALYRLDRDNVAVADPNDSTRSILVDAQRTHGFELELNGNVTRAWSVAGGYAYQNGEITRSISAAAQAGAVLAQLPRHSVSFWNKYEITARVAAGLGVLFRGESFTSTDNLVTLPNWTRADAAVYYRLTTKLRAQINVENLLDTRYYVSAHSNTNITPGSPRAVRVALTARF